MDTISLPTRHYFFRTSTEPGSWKTTGAAEKPSQPLLFLHPNTVKHFYNCADRCKSDVLLRHGLNQGFGITGSQ
jgi:hypothetical protein